MQTLLCGRCRYDEDRERKLRHYYLLHFPHHVQQFAMDNFNHFETVKENASNQTSILVLMFLNVCYVMFIVGKTEHVTDSPF